MFSKKKTESTSIATLIGAGTTVTGDMDFRGGLHLEGRIVGDVRGEPGSAATLTIGGEGVIEGSVSVDALVLNGTVRGDVTGRERVELGATAKVEGNVSYKVLQMQAGARVDGRLIHSPGGETGPEGLPETHRGPEGDGIPGLR
ncbi:MAG: bactofilin family protein [Gammaproteobacteria bacterium]